MAHFDVTQYKKHLEIQNISGSADASAPGGGVYLFASGSQGNARLYLQLEGDSHANAIDLAAGSQLGIAGDSGTGQVDLSAGQSFSVLTGDGLSTVASGQGVTVSVDAGGITNDMLAGSIASSKIAELNNFDTDDLSEGASNLYWTVARGESMFDSKLAAADTDDLSEGASNLYYTDARVRAAVSADGDLVSYDSSTGAFSTVVANFSGSWDVKMAAADTGDLAEGSNLYWTVARGESMFDTKLAAADTDDLSEGASNLYWTVARGESMFDSKMAAADTDDLAEGASNLYFTDARAIAAAKGALSADGDLISYSDGAFSTVASNFSASWDVKMAAADTGDLAEGSNLYYTEARWDAKMAAADTGDLAEGSNLYYTDARARASVSADGDLVLYNSSTGVFSSNAYQFSGSWDAKMAAADTDDLAEGASNLYWTVARGESMFDSKLAAADTDDLAEGASNLYYTDARVRAAVSAGDGLDFNSSTGVFSVDLKTLGGLQIDSTELAIDLNNLATVGGPVLAEDSIAYIDADGNVSVKTPVSTMVGNMAGAGLGQNSTSKALEVNVDDSSIEINLDTLRIKAAGITNDMLSGSIASSKIAELNSFDTDDLAEGASNLYYTDARVRAAVSADGDLISFDSSTGAFSTVVANFSASWDAKMAAADTGDLAEGSNLYWTTARGESMFDSKMAAADTDDLAEGASNLYFTDARARGAVSVNDAGGDGSLAYDSSTGVITYTGPSAAEVRAHFSGGTGVDITDGVVSVGQAIGTSDSPEFAGLTLGEAEDQILFPAADGSIESSADLKFVAGQGLKVGANISGSANVLVGGALVLGQYANGAGIANESGQGVMSITGQDAYFAADLNVTVDLGVSGDSVLVGDLTVGQDGAVDVARFHGDTSGTKMEYSADMLKFSTSGQADHIKIGGDASSDFAIDVSNVAGNGGKVRAAAFVTYSDESLKSDVEVMNTALDAVMALNGVEFTWKDSGERDFGFIAQEVAQVLPKAVHTAANGISGVDYSRLTSVLVEAVKAQQVQIEELKAILKK